MSEREHDIVLFGATGFAGVLTADYLARQAPPGVRIGLAARNLAKLAVVRDRLTAANPTWADVPLLHANVDDRSSLQSIAESSRIVVSTVGPYLLYGEPLIAACTETGTDYIDLAGEPAFVDRIWLRYHASAQRTGVRIIHSCGWTAVPHDLGTLFTVQRLPEGEPLTVRCFVRLSSKLSGGAYRSLITNIARPRETAWTGWRRQRVESRPTGRRVGAITRPPLRSTAGRGWRLPYPTIDRQTVLRSARALERYGPDFRYGHYLVIPRLAPLSGLQALRSYRRSGEGPTTQERAHGWFTQTFIGEGGGRRVITEVSGADPWYTEASKMLAESALCLACDDLSEKAGQLTPAVAMGEPLTQRLTRAGITFRVAESSDAACPTADSNGGRQ